MEGLTVRAHLDSNGQDLAIEHVRRLLEYKPETGEFFWKECFSNAAVAGKRAGSKGKNGYVSVQIMGRSYRAHRLVWFYVNGVWPTGEVDHANGVRSDNRIDNLRDATRSQNQANAARRKDNLSGYKGVRYHKATKKWMARIRHQHRSIYLGLFNSPEAASGAYKNAALEFHGEFARAA